MKIKTVRAALVSGGFDDIVEALKALASDPEADPTESAKAEAALKAMADDPKQPAAKRALASQAYTRATSSVEMRQKMGLSANRPAIVHDGNRSTFGPLTLEAAKKHLAHLESKR